MSNNKKISIFPYKRLILLFSVVLLALSICAWFFSAHLLGNEKQKEFAAVVNKVDKLMQSELNAYDKILLGARGLYEASEFVSRDEWRDYISSQNLFSDFSDLKSMTYLSYVDSDEKEDFLEMIRNDDSVVEGGYPDFNIFPELTSDGQFVVNYLQPQNEEYFSFGLDLASQDAYVEMLNVARDQNMTQMSPPISTFINNGGRPGFVMTHPIYVNNQPIDTVEERRGSVMGYAMAVFSSENFLNHILLNAAEGDADLFKGVEFTLFDSAAAEDPLAFYQGLQEEVNYDTVNKSRSFMFGGREWVLTAYDTNGQFSVGINDLIPWVTFLVTLFVSALMILLAIFWSRSYRQSLEFGKYVSGQLKQTKAVDKIIVQNLGEGLIMLNPKGNVTLINPAALDLLEYKKNEVIGKNFFSVVRPKTESGKRYDRKRLPVARVLNEELPMGYLGIKDRLFYSRKNGKTFPVAVTANRLNDKDNKLGVVVIFHDITDELETDRAKNEFVSIASHQLRTPITAINWFTETLLESGGMSKEHKTYLTSVYDSSQRAVRLINALLNVARIDTGTFCIEPIKVDFNKIVRQNLKDNQSAFTKKLKTMKMDIKLDKNIGEINADPEILYIICDNLISNAIKYTPKDKGTVKVHTAIYNKGTKFGGRDVLQTSVALKVSDSGYGIPEASQKRIFSKLFRADNVKENHQGTGLGLYVVKSIVEHGGGQIWFESAENQGTTFYVLFPRKGMLAKEGEKSLELEKSGVQES